MFCMLYIVSMWVIEVQLILCFSLLYARSHTRMDLGDVRCFKRRWGAVVTQGSTCHISSYVLAVLRWVSFFPLFAGVFVIQCPKIKQDHDSLDDKEKPIFIRKVLISISWLIVEHMTWLVHHKEIKEVYNRTYYFTLLYGTSHASFGTKVDVSRLILAESRFSYQTSWT